MCLHVCVCVCVCVHLFVMRWPTTLKPWPKVRRHLSCLHKSAAPNNFISSFFSCFLHCSHCWCPGIRHTHIHTHTHARTGAHTHTRTHTHRQEFLFSVVNPVLWASAEGSPPVILGWVDKLFKRQEGGNLCSSLPFCILCKPLLRPLAGTLTNTFVFPF